MSNLLEAVDIEKVPMVAVDSVRENHLDGTVMSFKDMYGNNPKLVKTYLGDAEHVAMHDANFAFLSTTLAKLYTKLVEPKHWVTYQDDVDIDVGGGFVDYIQRFSVNWSAIANQVKNVVGNGANYIPRVNAGMSQSTAAVYTFELAYDIRFIELEKMKKLQLQKSLEQIYKDVIAASWDFFCQKIAYTGGDANHYGLFNHDDIVPVNETNLSRAGIEDGTVSDAAIVGVINGIQNLIYVNSGMNPELIPDHFCVPSWFATALVGKISPLYNSNLYEYLIGYNYGTMVTGKKLKLVIVPRSDLDNAGAANAGRIVAYKKDKDFVRLDMPYPIKPFITLPNIERMGYTSAFVGQVSEIQLPYNTTNTDAGAPVQYWDFTA